MSGVIVLGSSNTDLTVKVERLPQPQETVTNGELMVSFGGKGANQALAALYAQADVTFMSKIGLDNYGNDIYDNLTQKGLKPDGLIRDPERHSGMALITVDTQGNNQISVAPGSNKNFTVSDLNGLKGLIQGGNVFLTQLEIPLSTAEHGLKLAKQAGLTTILDPAPYQPLSSDIFANTDIITPNEKEAAGLTGTGINNIRQARRAASEIMSHGCRKVIITLGRDGAFIKTEQTDKHIPSPGVEAIDSVAAGDAFNGVLAACLAEDVPLEEAVNFANAAGALSATKRGAQESLPKRKDIEYFLRNG